MLRSIGKQSGKSVESVLSVCGAHRRAVQNGGTDRDAAWRLADSCARNRVLWAYYNCDTSTIRVRF